MIKTIILFACIGAALGEWQILHRNLATIIMGLDFSDDNTGYFGGAVDGLGPAIFFTNDGGLSLTQQVEDPFALPGIIFDMSTNLDNINETVVSGLGGWFGLLGPGAGYTIDGGENWLESPDQIYLAAAYQDSQYIDDTAILTGSWINVTEYGYGIAVSENGGHNYVTHDWGIPGSDGYEIEPARYASFLSAQVGWVSGGHWPLEAQQDVLQIRDSNFQLSQYVRVRVDPKYAEAALEQKHNGYRAVVAKTLDGGETFEILYDYSGDYYFNQIAMVNETNGCAVAEGADAYVLCTQDGGYTWEITLQAAGTSVIAIEMIDTLHGWVGGTDLNGGFRSVFYETTDGGRTWNRVDFPDGTFHFVMNMSFPSSRTGYATALNLGNSSSTFKYTANKKA